MASVFDYPAVLQNQDEVRPSHGVEVVGNDQGRLSGHQAIQGFLDLRLALDVEASHRLVQDQDGGVADDGPRYSDPLSLTAREGVAPLADDGLVTIFKVHYELVGVGCFGGLENLLHGGVQLSVGDVLLDGGAEKDRVLEDDPDLLAQGLELVVLYVSPIDPDGASLGFVQAQDKADQGRLARSRSADQRHPLAGKDVKGDAFEDLAVVSVLEGDLAPQGWRHDSVWGVLYVGLYLQYPADALGAGRGLRVARRVPRHALERLVHALHIGREDQEISGRDRARKHLERPNQHDGRRA